MQQQTVDNTNDCTYSGTKILENLADAVNYNAALAGLVMQSLRPGPQSRVLDFGAGVGTFARILKTKGINPECLEIDLAEREVLAREGFLVHENLQGINDAYYDSIYTLNVLEHIEDDRAALRELHAKLAPHGTLFIFVPAFQLLYTDFDRMVGHHRRYRLSGLRKVVEDSGFVIETIRYFDSVGFFAALLFKLLGGNPTDVTPKKIRFFDRIAFPLNRFSDPLLQYFLGKNVYVVCRKTTSTHLQST